MFLLHESSEIHSYLFVSGHHLSKLIMSLVSAIIYYFFQFSYAISVESKHWFQLQSVFFIMLFITEKPLSPMLHEWYQQWNKSIFLNVLMSTIKSSTFINIFFFTILLWEVFFFNFLILKFCFKLFSLPLCREVRHFKNF